ncbi:MAG: alpha/beta hydrolase [Bryobacteraceae bacterium]
MTRRFFTAAFAAAPLVAGAGKDAPHSAGGNYNIPLWDDGKVPGAKGDGPLDKPFLTVFEPAPGKADGSAVVIAPGGSNIMLMYGAEGIDIAERYNEWGSTAFVLTYRLSPRYGNDARVADGNRAIQAVRARAAEMKLDPKRIGYIGFSAGSNMGRPVVAASTDGDPNSPDPVARVSSRPDYLGLVYGPGRPMEGEDLKKFPPTFLCAAQYDKFPALGSAQLFRDLTQAGVVAELHLYQKGRHGFGSGFGTSDFGVWMPALRHFLEEGGLIKK